MLVLYLDTNHLSRLARFPGEPDCCAVLALLDGQPVHLAITFQHIF